MRDQIGSCCPFLEVEPLRVCVCVCVGGGQGRETVEKQVIIREPEDIKVKAGTVARIPGHNLQEVPSFLLKSHLSRVTKEQL